MSYPGTKRRRRHLEVRQQKMGKDDVHGTKSPSLPHERDESPEPPSPPQPVEVQAHEDVERGLVDTDRRQDAVPVFERQRQKAK